MVFLRRPVRRMACAAALLSGAVLSGSQPAHAQFVYGITDNGRIYEIDVTAKKTTLAFTTGLNRMNGLAFFEGGDGGNGQVFYRNGTDAQNGSLDLYVWNRRTNTQTKVAVPSDVNGGVITGQASNASWFGGAYWYVQQNTDRLWKVSVDLSSLAAPTVTSIQSFTNFDNGALNSDGTQRTNFSFGDISISKDGVLYGSANGRFFQLDISTTTGLPSSATYKETVTPADSQLQIGFASDGVTLYGTSAGTGEWYKITDKTKGTTEALNFRSQDALGTLIAFNDVSEGSLRSVNAVVQPEPGSAALLLPLVPLVGFLRRRRVASAGFSHECGGT